MKNQNIKRDYVVKDVKKYIEKDLNKE